MAKTEDAVENGEGTEAPGGDEEQSIEAQAESLEEQLGQMPIPGTEGVISLDAGGEKPQSASLKLLGGSLPVEGEFAKGTRVRIWVEAVITEVAFVDHVGKDGYPEGTERRHKARMHRVRRVEE